MVRKMAHAPVYFAIMQVRFNPILTLDSYAPQIQEHFRRHGFPGAQAGALTTVNLAAATEESASQAPVVRTPRYTFCDINNRAAFILDPGALSLQTVDYDMFDGFLDTFRSGLQAVHDAVSLSFTDRIGFRYLDAVFPRADESLAAYLDGSVLGLGERVQETLVHSFSETRLRTSSEVNVVARVIIQDGGVGFPPDLLPTALPIADRFKGLQGRHAILDTDGSVEKREAFDLEQISKHFSIIHDEITKTFRATVTPYAIKAWGSS